jgi:hypothetical protein
MKESDDVDLTEFEYMSDLFWESFGGTILLWQNGFFFQELWLFY